MEWNVVCLGEAGGGWTVLQVVSVCRSRAHAASEQGPRQTHALLAHLSENPKRTCPGMWVLLRRLTPMELTKVLTHVTGSAWLLSLKCQFFLHPALHF